MNYVYWFNHYVCRKSLANAKNFWLHGPDPDCKPIICTVQKGQTNVPNRPKLVVGIVVDQMRWDYLYRYYDRYTADGGFKRLLNKGFTCENTFIPYTPTYTACGHTCVYTGSVPSIHGITGNNWYDNELKRAVYCTEDKISQISRHHHRCRRDEPEEYAHPPP